MGGEHRQYKQLAGLKGVIEYATLTGAMNRSHHDIKGRKPNLNLPLGGSRVNVGDLERRRADTLVPVIRVSDSRKKEVVGNLPRRANNRNPGEDSRSGSRSQGGPSTGKELAKKKKEMATNCIW